MKKNQCRCCEMRMAHICNKKKKCFLSASDTATKKGEAMPDKIARTTCELCNGTGEAPLPKCLAHDAEAQIGPIYAITCKDTNPCYVQVGLLPENRAAWRLAMAGDANGICPDCVGTGSRLVISPPKNEDNFIMSYNALAADVHENAKDKGWWDTSRNHGEMIALMHSELSEALEALRHGNPEDDHIPKFTGVEAELADTIIRIMDFGYAFGFHVAEAIIAKCEYNKTRPHKHGGKEF